MADTWTNLFDLGECTVAVYDVDGGVDVFSEVMEKGDSSGYVFNGTNTVTVSAGGAVTVDGPLVGQSQVIVCVIPSYAHDYAARIIDTSYVPGENIGLSRGGINLGVGDGSGTVDVDYLPYTDLEPAAPEPMDMTALTGTRDGVYCYIRSA